MSTYSVEEEQVVESIQQFWRKYGLIIIIGSILAIGGYLGWKSYKSSQAEELDMVSLQYTQLMEKLSTNGLSEQQNVQAFIDKNTDNNYSVLAALALSKQLVVAGNYQEAATQLNTAKQHTSDEILSNLIANRSARLLIEEKKYDEAISVLKETPDSASNANTQELIGDIYLLQEKRDLAYEAYQNAKNASSNSMTLQVKLDDLAK